eukprot:CFRG2175T1
MSDIPPVALPRPVPSPRPLSVISPTVQPKPKPPPPVNFKKSLSMEENSDSYPTAHSKSKPNAHIVTGAADENERSEKDVFTGAPPARSTIDVDSTRRTSLELDRTHSQPTRPNSRGKTAPPPPPKGVSERTTSSEKLSSKRTTSTHSSYTGYSGGDNKPSIPAKLTHRHSSSGNSSEKSFNDTSSPPVPNKPPKFTSHTPQTEEDGDQKGKEEKETEDKPQDDQPLPPRGVRAKANLIQRQLSKPEGAANMPHSSTSPPYVQNKNRQSSPHENRPLSNFNFADPQHDARLAMAAAMTGRTLEDLKSAEKKKEFQPTDDGSDQEEEQAEVDTLEEGHKETEIVTGETVEAEAEAEVETTADEGIHVESTTAKSANVDMLDGMSQQPPEPVDAETTSSMDSMALAEPPSRTPQSPPQSANDKSMKAVVKPDNDVPRDRGSPPPPATLKMDEHRTSIAEYISDCKLHKCHARQTLRLPLFDLLELSGQCENNKQLTKSFSSLKNKLAKIHKSHTDKFQKAKKGWTISVTKAEAGAGKAHHHNEDEHPDSKAQHALEKDIELVSEFDSMRRSATLAAYTDEGAIYRELESAEEKVANDIGKEESKLLAKKQKIEMDRLVKDTKSKSKTTVPETANNALIEGKKRHDEEREALSKSQHERRTKIYDHHQKIQLAVKERANNHVEEIARGI